MMNIQNAIPKGAVIAIDDLLDYCVNIQPGQEVVLLAHIDGLYGGDNLVDQDAISWIHAALQHRGANVTTLWIDEPVKPHVWRLPPVVKAALKACDVFINNSFDITWEEMNEFQQYVKEQQKLMVRNFATTSSLLNTTWAQTPYELVSEIRYQAACLIKQGASWKLTDDNGTILEGIINPQGNQPVNNGAYYNGRRQGYYRPWPEWVHPPINVKNTCGIFIFNSMLSWWSRYIGISPYFNQSIRLTIDNGRIKKIEGGEEAKALALFLNSMKNHLGEGVYDFNCFHFGIHPQAIVGSHQCSNVLYRRLIDHSHSSNIHFHIGAPPPTPSYPYWMHCTGDIRTATLNIGENLIYDHGHLTVLDNPSVHLVADKYPNRPCSALEPRSY